MKEICVLVTYCFDEGDMCLCLHIYQEYATKTRIGIRRGKTGQELKEAALEPSMEKMFKSKWQSLDFNLKYMGMS
jgi:hypothetical protein